jgi:hypothetical protein
MWIKSLASVPDCFKRYLDNFKYILYEEDDMNIETEEKLGRGLERICNALLFFVSQRPVDKEALEKKKAR